jgi:hypothetical protein
MENEEEEEEENGQDNDDLINDILTSDEEEEEEKITTRKTKLVPIGAIDDAEQETLRSLSFNERTKRKTVSTSRSNHQNQIPIDNDTRRKTKDDDHRKNIRRAPRGRMNSRRGES